ncbi:hypothetical protein D9756_001069 [Leucocoprinus leucothites]|uniref:Fungal-type protein kinase domain-containing protein n=1 Tax=Leucocoprinus leucothites TaxID=201217 RepID=A0A8H5LNE2_9AGAR|nr:hypothetical protein D9756_001069 [Leucoagaricus leucothites]
MRHEMLRCPVDLFLDLYAPYKPPSHFLEYAYGEIESKCLNPLKTGTGSRPGTRLAWKAFGSLTPSDMDPREEQVFANLEDIINVLHDLDDDEFPLGRELTFRYKNTPYAEVKSEKLGGGFKWDAYIRPREVNSDEVIPADAAVIAEFKKKATHDEIQKNRSQLVSAASHVMNDDPRRMWMYGITIEDERVSLWYFSRSHSMKSESFDFTRDFKTFVHTFVSFLFATKAEMGFDPTVHRVEIANEYRYVYEVQKRFFLTKAPIFDPRVLCISGRKTRVWMVVEVASISKDALRKPLDNGKEYALKDVWLDEGSLTEGKILSHIFARLDHVSVPYHDQLSEPLANILDETLRNKQYERYFMNIVCDQEGRSTRSVPEDGRVQPNPQILDMTPSDLTDEKAKRSTLRGSTQNFSGRRRAGSAPPSKRDYKTKRQYRLVYADVGKPIHDGLNLGSFFQAIHDTFIALLLMLLANWVHRDISTGNIILVETAPGKFIAKLSDLEYAKEFSDKSVGSTDPKTVGLFVYLLSRPHHTAAQGTPYFMPWEVHSGQPLRDLQAPLFPPGSRAGKPFGPFVLPNNIPKCWPPFYRFDYDLESIWWVILWTLLFRVPYKPARDLSERVFTYSTKPSDDKTSIFKIQGHPSINEAMHPALKMLVSPIQWLHALLWGSYAQAPEGINGYLQIYNNFWTILEQVPGLVNKIVDFEFSDPDSPVQTGEKRSRQDSAGDGMDDTGDETVGEEDEVEAGGSQKRQRVSLNQAATSRNPGTFARHVQTRR